MPAVPQRTLSPGEIAENARRRSPFYALPDPDSTKTPNDEYAEFLVCYRDRRQDCVHDVREVARSQQEANSLALKWLQANFRHSDFDLV